MQLIGDALVETPVRLLQFSWEGRRLVRSVTIDEGPVLRTSEGFTQRSKMYLRRSKSAQAQNRAQLHQTVDLVVATGNG